VPRRYSAAETAKRERKFRINLARRENPIRGKAAIEQEMAWLRRKAAAHAEDVRRDRERGLI
jgi:hypothetical protein